MLNLSKIQKFIITTSALSLLATSMQTQAASLNYQNECFPQIDNGGGYNPDEGEVEAGIPDGDEFYRNLANDGIIQNGECSVIGSLVANQYAANNIFSMRLEDRLGASNYQKPNQDLGQVWIRGYAGHNKFKTLFNDLKTSGDSYAIQLGSDLFKFGEQD